MIFKRDVWNGELYAADPEKLSRVSAEASWGDRWEPRAAEAHILSPLALFSKWQSKLNNSRIVKKNNNNFLVLSPDLLPAENWIQSNPEWYIYRKFPLHFQSWTFHVGVKGGDRKGGSEYWSSDRTFVSTSAGSQTHMSCHRRWRKIKMPITRSETRASCLLWNLTSSAWTRSEWWPGLWSKFMILYISKCHCKFKRNSTSWKKSATFWPV